jgi:AcrR family transcriptional regulator
MNLYDGQGSGCGEVRTRGWGGTPPRDEAEARRRILSATRELLALASRDGSTNISEVAAAVGVTRQTVYRYYPTTEDLLNAASLDAVADLTTDLVRHVRKHVERLGEDPGEVAVEVVAYVYEHLRDDPVLNRLIAPGRIGSTLTGLTASSSILIGRSLLAELGVAWTERAVDADVLPELVEHLLRTLQSLVLDPGEPARSGEELRDYLRRWLAPAVRARAQVQPT